MSLQERLDTVLQLNKYFKRFSEHPTGAHELRASDAINKVLIQQGVNESSLRQAADIFNSASEQNHLDGSGWLDLRLRLEALARAYGLIVQDDNNSIVIS